MPNQIADVFSIKIGGAKPRAPSVDILKSTHKEAIIAAAGIIAIQPGAKQMTLADFAEQIKQLETGDPVELADGLTVSIRKVEQPTQEQISIAQASDKRGKRRREALEQCIERIATTGHERVVLEEAFPGLF